MSRRPRCAGQWILSLGVGAKRHTALTSREGSGAGGMIPAQRQRHVADASLKSLFLERL